ncbi:MAG: hypothetical protein ABL871_16935 [Terricaulis sp.]
MARLLRQGKSLRTSANEITNDVNEAYLVVHQIITHAIGRIGDDETDLHPALMIALRSRSQRLAAAI